jgi:hypothetical protein
MSQIQSKCKRKVEDLHTLFVSLLSTLASMSPVYFWRYSNYISRMKIIILESQIVLDFIFTCTWPASAELGVHGVVHPHLHVLHVFLEVHQLHLQNDK